MGKSGGNARIREALWTKDPHCNWCGVVTIPPRRVNGQFPDNAATLDHLRSRIDRRFGWNPQLEGQTVLACFKCNQKRGADQVREIFTRRLPCPDGDIRSARIRQRRALAHIQVKPDIQKEQREYSELLDRVRTQLAISVEE